MAHALVKPLENGQYVGTITGIKTTVSKSVDQETVKVTYDMTDDDQVIRYFDNEVSGNLDMTSEELDTLTDEEKRQYALDAVQFYTIQITLDNGRVIATNKFRNKVQWTDENGQGWTSLDFFTSGIQRQKSLEDETDDVKIMMAAENVCFWISQYTNPRTFARSYNIDTKAPKPTR